MQRAKAVIATGTIHAMSPVATGSDDISVVEPPVWTAGPVVLGEGGGLGLGSGDQDSPS